MKSSHADHSCKLFHFCWLSVETAIWGSWGEFEWATPSNPSAFPAALHPLTLVSINCLLKCVSVGMQTIWLVSLVLLLKFISIRVAARKPEESLWADGGSLSPITGSVTKGRQVVCVSPEKPCCVSTDLCLHIWDKVFLRRDDTRRASAWDDILVWGRERSEASIVSGSVAELQEPLKYSLEYLLKPAVLSYKKKEVCFEKNKELRNWGRSRAEPDLDLI